MHAGAVARGTDSAGDMCAMGVVVGVECADDIERGAINVTAAGCHPVVTVGGEFGMGCIEARIELADFHAFTGDAGGIGLIGLHAGESPVALELRRAPTGGIARRAGFQISGLHRDGHCRHQE